MRLIESRGTCPRHGPVEVTSEPSQDASAQPEASETSFALNGYEIAAVLGVGGFGTVYRAKRLADGRTVAIKTARSDQATAASQLAAEIQALDAIDSPHVPELIEHGETEDGQAYFVMQHVHAPMLADTMAERAGAMDTESFYPLAQSLLVALEAVHRAGFVHRDIKPDNFFVDKDRIWIFDFGLSLPRTQKTARAEASWVGTPEYMAPEQCEGKGRVDHMADLYAVGVILYELLCGRPPFLGPDGELREQHRSRRPPSLEREAGIASPLARVIRNCLQKDRSRRPQSTQELGAQLEAAHRSEPSQSSAPSTSATASPPLANSEGEAKPKKKRSRKAQRERRMVGLLWFESNADVGEIQAALAQVSGQLANTSGGRHVVAFGHETGDNPVRSALNAARKLIGRGLARKATVDTAAVGVRTRPDGTLRYLSPLFSRTDRYPTADDPNGTLITSSASDLVPETQTEPSAREGLLITAGMTEQTQVTMVRYAEEPFIGHEDLLQCLRESSRSASAGCPTLVSIIADAGLGKSQLAGTLSRSLASDRMPYRIDAMRALPPVGDVLHTTLDEMIRRLLRLPLDRPDDGGADLFRDRLGEQLADNVRLGLSIALDWVDPDDPELRKLRAAPGALRSSVAFAVGKTLRQLATKQPIALVIDDAHYTDEVLLDALEYAALEEGGAAIWVCMLARPALLKARPAFGDRAATRLALDLPPLDPVAAAKLARLLLEPARSIPESAIRLLTERTQGVPLLLAELIRGLKRDGVVRPRERGTGWYLATDELEKLPALPAVQWLAATEVEALPPQLAAHARLASTLGASFTEPDLDGLMEQLEQHGVALDTLLDAAVGMKRLRRADILVRDALGNHKFRHALLGETLYASVPDTLKTAAHRAAYTFYRDQANRPKLERLPHIAFHASCCGLAEEAAPAYLELAERGRGQHAYLEAESLYGKALENLPAEDPRTLHATWGLGLMRFRMGRNLDALKGLERALELAQASDARGDQISILLDAATVLDWLDDHPRSKDLVQQADDLSEGERSELLECRFLLGHGRSLFRFGDIPEGCRCMLEAADRAEPLGDAGYETFVISLLMSGAGLGMVGNAKQAMPVLDRALSAARARGDTLHIGAALQGRVFALIVDNDMESVITDSNAVIELARQTGATVLEGRSVYNLGEITYLMGDLEEAEKNARRSIELHGLIAGPGGRTLVSQLLLARVHTVRGELAAASRVVQEFRNGQARAREQNRGDAELLPSDQVLLDLVVLSTESAGAEAWTELLERSERDSVQQERIEVLELRGIAAARAHESEVARKFLEAALATADKTPNLMRDRVEAQLRALTAA